MLSDRQHLQYILDFTNVYQKFSPGGTRPPSPSQAMEREIACQRLRLENAFLPVEPGDIFAGRYQHLGVSVAPQEYSLGYMINESEFQQLMDRVEETDRIRLEEIRRFWRENGTAAKIRAAYTPEMTAALPSDRYLTDRGVGFPLYRTGGTHLDYKALLRGGIPGLKERLLEKRENAPESSEARTLYEKLAEALDLLTALCLRYREQARALGLPDMADSLDRIASGAPESLRDALQLVHLYALVSGSLNYGRMDDWCGRFLKGDPGELDLVVAFWKGINQRGCTWDGRVILGGRGREDEEAADRFALLAMEASRVYRDILPQLTLRFYDGQNPALLEKAYSNYADGCVYPMLYRDEINVPAVQDAFGLPEEEAEQFVPFGCGEYILDHRSLGSPNGIINLLEALNRVILDDSREYPTFEDLFTAYRQLVESQVSALAKHQSLEDRIAGQECPYLYLTLLYDDCIARGRPLLTGGARYRGGTLETYGNTNTADSLTAIRRMVYEDKRMTLSELRRLLRDNFAGGEVQRQALLRCPKYGNDLDEADEMLVRVHEHICRFTAAQAAPNGLASYLVVIINNNTNTYLGLLTGASADGRRAGEPMANANNPTSGMDVSGLTAFLNSLVKPDCHIHAGAVQNMKFSRELFRDHGEVVRALMNAYFRKGQQAMFNILDRGELEDALAHPERHGDLIVRVGGFCARFVTLDRDTQKEIVSRMLYGADAV